MVEGVAPWCLTWTVREQCSRIYGSKPSLIQLIDCGAEFLGVDLAIQMSLKDTPRFIVEMEILDSKIRNVGKKPPPCISRAPAR